MKLEKKIESLQDWDFYDNALHTDFEFDNFKDCMSAMNRRLLESNQHNVNEVGLKVGYSTSSHFIAAFKKKFGTTPKKYVMSLNN